jgi:lauroyl/myristoyl acyltransferase
MEWLLIVVARVLLPVLQILPLTWVARLGRAGGALAYALDRRHRRVALGNLKNALGCPDIEARRIARENFRRIGENYACGMRAAGMSWESLQPHIEWHGLERLKDLARQAGQRSVIIATGHFGNFELLARVQSLAEPGWRVATTYRALRQEVATRMLLRLREKSGCLFFERRREMPALRKALREQKLLLGLLADQHDGRGVRVPFLGRDASTSIAPALFALRYRCPLLTVFCFRVGLARWRLEMGDRIPTRDEQGRPRSTARIARDMNASFERAVLRDPANWFWVHRRWKPARNSRPS